MKQKRQKRNISSKTEGINDIGTKVEVKKVDSFELFQQLLNWRLRLVDFGLASW